MGLGRKFSQMSLSGRSKKTSPDGIQNGFPSSNRGSLFSVPETESTSMLQEVLEQHEIQQTQIKQQQDIIDNLTKEDHALESRVEELNTEIMISKQEGQNLREQIAMRIEEKKNHEWELSLARNTVSILENSCREKDEAIEHFKQILSNTEREVENAKGEARNLSQHTSNQSNAIKVLSGHNQQLQANITGLEDLLRAVSGKTGRNLQSFFDHYNQLKKTNEEAAPKLQDVQRRVEEMERNFQTANETIEGLSTTVTEKDDEIAALKTRIDQIKEEDSRGAGCYPRTLRSLLMMRLLENGANADTSGEDVGAVQTTTFDIPQVPFDKICTPSEIQTFVRSINSHSQFYQHIRLVPCTVCHKQKFFIDAEIQRRNQSMKRLNEYMGQSRFFSCCYEKVCKECFMQQLLDTLEWGWWYRVGSLQWFSCPREECEEFLGIRCEADLDICLAQNYDGEVEAYVKMYKKALALRKALAGMESISKESIGRAAKLSKTLIKLERMYSPFDSRFDTSIVDENGCIPDFDPGHILTLSMEKGPSPVPLFPKFLKREKIPKDCMVCTKTLFEIDFGGDEEWKITCEGFEGSWMWRILVFPTREVQECDHEYEVCRCCTAEHIKGTLVSGGPSACDSLSCPQCRRKLAYQEVHKLSDEETAAKYEKFLLQTFLSNEPNFRWCLNPLCENGEVYEENLPSPKISCGICDFEMCFTHQQPWHDGLTCEEFDSLREHGDPSYAQTQEWIKTNTKPCPGCQVGIQKGEACFHMTCTQCDAEFCWVCLADWKEISEIGQRGHKEDCFFRSHDIRPTGVRGENLEDALRAREREQTTPGLAL